MRERLKLGFHDGGYSAKCIECDTVANFPISGEEAKLLSIKYKDRVNQEQLFQTMNYFTLIKIERECSCQAE